MAWSQIMAITLDATTDGNFTVLNNANSNASVNNFTAAGAWNDVKRDTTSKVEGNSCVNLRVNAGTGTLVSSHSSRSLENTHLRMWVRIGQALSINTGANGGAQLIAGTSQNHVRWNVYDLNTQVVVYNGWMMLVTDPRKVYAGSSGSIPNLLSLTSSGVRVNFLDGNGKDLAIGDLLWVGNELSVEGGTTGARGTFAEWSAEDRTQGWGILRSVGGVYYTNAGSVFQGVGTTDSYFQDTNQLIVFENLPVSGSLYNWRHVGNGTGTNFFQLGNSSGTGTTKTGSEGGVLRAAGNAPFRITAIDANASAAYYGVQMNGTTALYNDQVRNVKRNDGGSFIDDTVDFNQATGTVSPFPTPGLNDAWYVGHDEIFYEINLNVTTANTSGTYTTVFEYWDGSAWSALTDVTDGTNSLRTTGTNAITYSKPDDWAKTTVNSDSRYWVRSRISVVGTAGTDPIITQGTVAMAGDINLETSTAEMISCNISKMGCIKIRNGAFLTKSTIDGSVVPAKHAAVDFGDTNPATNTVRDLTIQNCNKGILLKGTSTGATSYTLTNIFFNNNTADVRVDFPAGATITINISGGDTPSIDNVNGSTVTIANPVTVTISGLLGNTEISVLENPSPYSSAAAAPVSLFNQDVLSAVTGTDIELDTGGTANITRILSTGTSSFAAMGLTAGDKVRVSQRSDLKLFDTYTYTGGSTVSAINVTAVASSTSKLPAIIDSPGETVTVEKVNASYSFQVASGEVVDFLAFREGSLPVYQLTQTILVSNNSFPLSQTLDRNFDAFEV
jgi:hypothetical protein